jgi:hypothetical protein
MRSWDGSSVFDRAPVLLGAGAHLAYVGEQAISVAAKCAVDLFDPVQVRELVTIEREVPTARHTCHSVDGETDRLIERHPEIEDDERKQQRVDDWSGEKAEEVSFKDVCRNALPKPSMRFSKLLVEPHPAAANPVVPSALLVPDLTFEIFPGIMKTIEEAAHIRWHRTFVR